MKNLILSVRQPWIWAMVHAGKPVENRTWPTKIRGRVFLHAPKIYDFEGHRWIEDTFKVQIPRQLIREGICAETIIVNCVTRLNNPWFFGPFGFVMNNTAEVPFYECKGALGFFNIPEFDKLRERYDTRR